MTTETVETERTLDPEQRERVEKANALIREAYAMLTEGDDAIFTDKMPVGRVQWVHIDKVQANDYNPNSVARHEMSLLHTSISEDGYTQPVVTIWDENAGEDGTGRYVIVDGFHRYTTMRRYADIRAKTGGYLPIVILDKSVSDRIAATVRHNRARGKHSVSGMGNLVFRMLEEGESDATICRKLGLEPEELVRLKHVTGFSKLFADREYSKPMLVENQLRAKAEYKRAHPDEYVPNDC